MPYVQVHIFSMNRMERIVLNGKITHCARRVIGGTALDGYLIQEVLKGPCRYTSYLRYTIAMTDTPVL